MKQGWKGRAKERATGRIVEDRPLDEVQGFSSGIECDSVSSANTHASENSDCCAEKRGVYWHRIQYVCLSEVPAR